MRAGGLDRFRDALAGDEPPRKAAGLAHAVPRREAFQGVLLGEERKSGFRQSLEHQCVVLRGGVEQVLDRARVVAQRDAIAHAQRLAFLDEHVARHEGRDAFVRGLPRGAHGEVGARPRRARRRDPRARD